MNSGAAKGLVGGFVYGRYLNHQPAIFSSPTAFRPFMPGILADGRNACSFSNPLDPKLADMSSHGPVPHNGRFEQMAIAF